MFAYYCNLALRSFRRDKALTVLMVLAIALGIGACMTTLTTFYVLSGDPIPTKSSNLYYVQLDPAEMNDYTPDEEPSQQVTRYDAEALLREKRGDRQALMTGGGVSVSPGREGVVPFVADARYTSADFFPMFEVPLLYGQGWSAKEDEAHARVAVISRSLNDKVFGGGDSTGKQLRIDQTDFTVVGVVDEWRPTPRFYDMNSDRYGALEDVFLPFTTSRDLEMGRNGSMDCWGDSDGDATGPNAPCVWIQYWVELDSPAEAAAYKDYLVNYSDQQRAAGRYKRPTNVRLRNVMEWLEFNRVVPTDVVMQLWLGIGFLLVCLVNTVGLLLAKFLRRGSEIGVRRALGASRRAIFTQCLVEAGAVGLAGGILGLGLSLLGLWAVRQQPSSYAQLAHLDLGMLLLTFALSIVASVLAGLLPAWRAMQVTPAIQLKSQ
ncbi:ABC transporter ATP-binding protein [Pseudoxanthomonas jiangsuensis]|uniref:ABC transporter permease n=1 Tax=Pseudoxanthomonas jiangsuensis TaxID=619688 RepID=UPI001391C2E9|nr:ABC transporter permease [Pseudoxanthomonas jiangsuensis]KAF1699399.1 ABC transporter ATP-binding protein [Pseudoxanthomonas jiangsuensis]